MVNRSTVAVLVAFVSSCASETATDKGAGSSDVEAADTASVKPVTAVVDETGGEVVAGAAKVVIPAGAVADAVEITVGPPEGTVVAPEVRFEAAAAPTAFLPHGTTFTTPVTLVLPYSGAAEVVLRLSDENDLTWEVVPGATFADGFATVQVTSFSIYLPAGCGSGATPGSGTCAPPPPADCTQPPPASFPAGQIACWGGLMSELACTAFGSAPDWNWSGNGQCTTGGSTKDPTSAAYLENKHRGDGGGSDVYNLGVCCQYAPAAPIVAQCTGAPPVTVPAGQVACWGGHMDEANCTTFGSSPDWNWSGNGQCTTGGSTKDPTSAAYLENKHRGDGGGSDVYNLGVCCQFQPNPSALADCSAPPSVAAPPEQIACWGGLMTEVVCDAFGATGDWTWAGNGTCVTGGAAKDATAASYLEGKHRGDGSGVDVYNLGVCCRLEPKATPGLTDCSKPSPVTIPSGQIACWGGYMDEPECTKFGPPPGWNWVGGGQCTTGGSTKTQADADYTQNKARGDGSGSPGNLGVCCGFAP